MKRVHIVGFHNVEQRVLGVGAVPADELDSLDVGVEQAVRSSLVLGAEFGGMDLRDVKEHVKPPRVEGTHGTICCGSVEPFDANTRKSIFQSCSHYVRIIPVQGGFV